MGEVRREGPGPGRVGPTQALRTQGHGALGSQPPPSAAPKALCVAATSIRVLCVPGSRERFGAHWPVLVP